MQQIEWSEVDSLEPGCGHGIEFYAGRAADAPMLAFLHGYDWLHKPGNDLRVSMLRPSDVYPEELLEKLKEKIAAGVRAKKFDEQVMGEEFTIMFNA